MKKAKLHSTYSSALKSPPSFPTRFCLMADIKLQFAVDAPPLSVIASAKLAGIPISVEATLSSGSAPTLLLPNGLKLHGAFTILRYIGRQAAKIPNLYIRDDLESTQIDEWLDYAPIFALGSEFEGACSYVDGYLLHRTFLVGYSLSIADLAIWSGLAGIDINYGDNRRME